MKTAQLKLASALDPAAQPALNELSRRMAEYYNRPEMAAYYGLHHSLNERWTEETEHIVILRAAKAGMKVVDLGCGSGHSYLNLKDAGVEYTGVDISEKQMQANRLAYADSAGGLKPAFIAASLYETGLPADSFDLTFSTYVLEHLVWPHRFLRETVRITRPGGRIIILCPHFRPGGRIPSLVYGKTVATLKERLKGGRIFSALRHLYLRNVYYPQRLAREFPADRFPFLINLEPSCFHGPYYADNDAIYFTQRSEIVAELGRAGAVDVTAEFVKSVGFEMHPESCMVVAEKRDADAKAQASR